MVILALFPPLFFRVMNPKITKLQVYWNFSISYLSHIVWYHIVTNSKAKIYSKQSLCFNKKYYLCTPVLKELFGLSPIWHITSWFLERNLRIWSIMKSILRQQGSERMNKVKA
jgi:hypothetical protein